MVGRFNVCMKTQLLGNTAFKGFPPSNDSVAYRIFPVRSLFFLLTLFIFSVLIVSPRLDAGDISLDRANGDFADDNGTFDVNIGDEGDDWGFGGCTAGEPGCTEGYPPLPIDTGGCTAGDPGCSSEPGDVDVVVDELLTLNPPRRP